MKNIKFNEVVLKGLMKPGDIFEVMPGQTFSRNIVAKKGDDTTWFIWEGSEKKEVFAIKAVLELWGKIIPAEPVVLTADQWFDKQPGIKYIENEETKHLVLCWTGSAFNDAHQNGRLERDIELRPLVEEVCNYIGEPTTSVAQARIFAGFLEKLKPLNPDD